MNKRYRPYATARMPTVAELMRAINEGAQTVRVLGYTLDAIATESGRIMDCLDALELAESFLEKVGAK